MDGGWWKRREDARWVEREGRNLPLDYLFFPHFSFPIPPPPLADFYVSTSTKRSSYITRRPTPLHPTPLHTPLRSLLRGPSALCSAPHGERGDFRASITGQVAGHRDTQRRSTLVLCHPPRPRERVDASLPGTRDRHCAVQYGVCTARCRVQRARRRMCLFACVAGWHVRTQASRVGRRRGLQQPANAAGLAGLRYIPVSAGLVSRRPRRRGRRAREPRSVGGHCTSHTAPPAVEAGQPRLRWRRERMSAAAPCALVVFGADRGWHCPQQRYVAATNARGERGRSDPAVHPSLLVLSCHLADKSECGRQGNGRMGENGGGK